MRYALLALILALVHFASADTTGTIALPPYNEVTGPSGELNPAYAEFVRRSGVNPYPVSAAAVNALMGMPLNDAIKILPIPAVLSTADYARLQQGARLRARTLARFFADVMFDGAAKVIASKILTEQQIQAIFRTENEAFILEDLRRMWSGRSLKDVGFIFGPDVVRNPKGEFRVLEDNVGLIGGIGDLAATHQAFFSAHGSTFEFQPPLVEAIKKFVNGQTAAVIYRRSKSTDGIKPADQEDVRIREIAAGLGLKVIDLASLTEDSQDLYDILNGKYQKLVNISAIHNLKDPATRDKIFEAFRARKFDLFAAPGITAVGSKALLPVMDKLTELYFSQSAQLATQPTEWILAASELDKIRKGWVVKKSNGAQGSEVYVLDHLTEEGRQNLILKVTQWEVGGQASFGAQMPYYVRQELVDPSYIPADLNNSWVKFNVDFRPHVFVVNGEPSTPAIWGRASWKIPGVLNNVSQSAMELIVTTPGQCERTLMSAPP